MRGDPELGLSRWLPGPQQGLVRAKEQGQVGEANPPKDPSVCCCRQRGLGCVSPVSVLVKSAWGLVCVLSWRVSRRQGAITKFRAADSHGRSCVCRLPNSAGSVVLLTFQTSALGRLDTSRSPRAAESPGRFPPPGGCRPQPLLSGVTVVRRGLVRSSSGHSLSPKPSVFLPCPLCCLCSGKGHISSDHPDVTE